MDRSRTFLWMRDLVEHLRDCADHWQAVAGRPGEGVWADAIRRDLDELRKLSDGLRGTAAVAR